MTFGAFVGSTNMLGDLFEDQLDGPSPTIKFDITALPNLRLPAGPPA